MRNANGSPRATVGQRSAPTSIQSPGRRPPATRSDMLALPSSPGTPNPGKNAVQPPGLIHTIQQLSTLEACLWSILEGLRSDVTYVAFFCREYWGTSASKALASVERFEWSEKLQRQVHLACVLEYLTMALASHLCSGTMREVSMVVRSKLQNLVYHIHENTLVLLDLMRQRMLAKSQGPTVALENGMNPLDLNFDMFLRVDRYRTVRKGEHSTVLKQLNDAIANMLRQLCRQASSASKVSISRGSSGMLSPGSPGRTSRIGSAPNSSERGVLAAVSAALASSTPLDRVLSIKIRASMIQHMHFQPLLNLDADPESPWPEEDPYVRFGSHKYLEDAPIIWFEPLPPMMADLERAPQLPPPPSDESYCLVLDLDETLVHYFEQDGQGTYGIRPFMHEFLERMESLGFELVIFTAATQDYADWVIGQIDPDGLIKYRLYRQHALPWGPLFVKDMSRLGRDMERTLIIDNVQENFMLHPNNGIFIATWYDDPDDRALSELTPLLEELITTRVSVPSILDKYREQIPVWAGFSSDLCYDMDPSFEDGMVDDGVYEDEHVDAYAPAADITHLQGGARQPVQQPQQIAQQATRPGPLQAPPPVSQSSRPGPCQAPPPARSAQPHQQQAPAQAPAQAARTAGGTNQWSAGTPPVAHQPLHQHPPMQMQPQTQTQARPFYAASGIAGPYQAQQSYAVPQTYQQPANSTPVGRYQRPDANGHDFTPYARPV